MRIENRGEQRRDSGRVVERLENVSFSTFDHILFKDLELNLRRGEVTAITGKSGSGKTVLLKIIAGIEHPAEGRVQGISNPRIGYASQELEDVDIDPNSTIKQTFKDVRGLTDLERKITNYEELARTNPDNYSAIEKDHFNSLEAFQELGGYNPEPEMKTILAGLKVDEHSTRNITLDTKLSEVSSGQLRKIIIARALYAKPDILLLDDPTSHLDAVSVMWLLNYLKNSKAAIVIASNNSSFIDGCANQTIGLTDIGRVFLFSGGYSEFVKKRDAMVEAEQNEAKSVKGKLDQLRETDQKFRAKQVYKRSADMAQVGRALATRMKKLEERYAELPGSKQIYRDKKIPDLMFKEERRSGENVVTIKKVIKKYGDHIAVNLKQTQSIDINRGNKWLVWGPNGSGKSTLVRMIAHTALNREFVPDEGEIKIGAAVDTAYFAPDEVSIMGKGKIIDEVAKTMKVENKGVASSALRFFGFPGSAIYEQDVRTLSSGERKRLGLAKIMLQNPNLLILDEPTGDYMFDEIKQRLAMALNGFKGTLILVSHDVSFIKLLNLHHELQMPSGKIVLRS